jgi:hypothetical protein
MLWNSSRGIGAGRPAEYRALSRSWASVNGPVSYNSQRIWASDKDRRPETVFYNFRILESLINDSLYETIGAISGGRMRVRGCLKAAFIDIVSPDNSISDRYYRILFVEGTSVGIVYPERMRWSKNDMLSSD